MYISVVLVVYDGIFFNKVLKSLIEQFYDHKKFEIIVVNNSRTYINLEKDETISGLNIKLYYYSHVNIVQAFFFGISKAKYTIIASLHEHMEPAPDWLIKINDAFESHVNLCMLFGRVIINPETKFPNYFEEASFNKPRSKLFAYLGEINLSSTFRELQEHESLGIGNFAFNSVLFDTTVFAKRKCRKGKQELLVFKDLLRIILIGKKVSVYYHPELITYKLIDLKELKPCSLMSSSYKMGFYDGKRDIQITKNKVRALTIYPRRTIRYLLSFSFYRTLFNKDKSLTEKKCNYLYNIGYSIGLFFAY